MQAEPSLDYQDRVAPNRGYRCPRWYWGFRAGTEWRSDAHQQLLAPGQPIPSWCWSGEPLWNRNSSTSSSNGLSRRGLNQLMMGEDGTVVVAGEGTSSRGTNRTRHRSPVPLQERQRELQVNKPPQARRAAGSCRANQDNLRGGVPIDQPRATWCVPCGAEATHRLAACCTRPVARRRGNSSRALMSPVPVPGKTHVKSLSQQSRTATRLQHDSHSVPELVTSE